MSKRDTPGDWLKRARTSAGYTTQESLAQALGVSRGAVGNWETIGRPGLEIVPLLAQLLGVGQGEIVERFHIDVAGPVRPAPADELTAAVREQTQVIERIATAVEQLVADGAGARAAQGELLALAAHAQGVDLAALGLGGTPAAPQRRQQTRGPEAPA